MLGFLVVSPVGSDETGVIPPTLHVLFPWLRNLGSTCTMEVDKEFVS